MLIKFCGMRNAETLELAAHLGVKLCGFIFHAQSPRFIQASAVKELPSFGMLRTGIFVRQTEDEIREISKIAHLDLIQLHGLYDENCANRLGKERIIRVIWPERFKSRDDLEQYLHKFASSSNFFLFDAGLSLGGSGKNLDISILKDLKSPRPWFLAGGLSAENINIFLNQIQPDGLDLNSGLESTPGIKDKEKMKAFFQNLNKSIKNGDRV